MAAPIVFFDIAGPDSSALSTFYQAVFDWDCSEPARIVPGTPVQLEGAIRQDPAEKVLYLGVPDITATLSQIEAAGGSIDVPRFEVPGTVVLGLFKDPAGNRMGLVEMNGDQPVIP